MKTLDEIRELLSSSDSEAAIAELDKLIGGGGDRKTLAMAYYLRGNAHRQRGEWREAMNNYLEAIDLDPDGPATQAYSMVQNILAYYHKDYYNP